MKRLLVIILVVLTGCASVVPGGQQSTTMVEFDLQRVCIGSAYAGVVEHQGSYYVIVSSDPMYTSYHLFELSGIKVGGRQIMGYFYENIESYREVYVLKRTQFSYTGYQGAASLCKQMSQEFFSGPNPDLY